jgi:hypothetical protein
LLHGWDNFSQPLVLVCLQICFDKFISQLQLQQTMNYPQVKAWNTNLEKLIMLQGLPRISDPQPTARIEQRAMWNPFVGGMFLTYLTYYANLEGGAATIDSFAQLRIVLHLCNAFKQTGLIQEGDLPVLDTLDCYFEDCKAIWDGSKPEQGDFVFRWWMAYGMTAETAMSMSEHTRKLTEKEILALPSYELLRARSCATQRRLTRIKPEDISKSFKRICLRDYSDFIKRYVPDNFQHKLLDLSWVA